MDGIAVPKALKEAPMPNAGRKLAFVLASSNHGTMIVNRFDYRMVDSQRGYGVGFQILETAAFDPMEVKLALELLGLRRRHFGGGVVAIDCGANIGVHTIEWAKTMTGWGSVLAIEAQERIFYALAGNISINNCFNARAIHAAIGAESGIIRIPTPDYLKPASFGSLELKRRESNEYIGQQIDYSDKSTTPVSSITLDSLAMNRVDLLKIDVEGMEIETLTGADNLIKSFGPIIIAEWIKSPKEEIKKMLNRFNYTHFE